MLTEQTTIILTHIPQQPGRSLNVRKSRVTTPTGSRAGLEPSILEILRGACQHESPDRRSIHLAHDPRPNLRSTRTSRQAATAPSDDRIIATRTLGARHLPRGMKMLLGGSVRVRA